MVEAFFLKKVGGALIRVGALNRDYTVFSSPFGMRNVHFRFSVSQKVPASIKVGRSLGLGRKEIENRFSLFFQFFFHAPNIVVVVVFKSDA